MGWKIDDWKKFEPPLQNDRKQVGGLKWWKCPVGQNRRYKLLVMSGPKGWEMLGIWHALVASWGRQTRESRQGGMLRTALAGNDPALLSELASDTLVPQAKLKPAIAKFLEMGWLGLESNCNPNGIHIRNPDGIQTDSETRLEETRQDKIRKEYIDIPNCSKVRLTQEDYDWLVSEWDKARVDAMILEAEDYFCSKPKKCASRNHKLTVNNWIRRNDDKAKAKQSGKPDPQPGKYAHIDKYGKS